MTSVALGVVGCVSDSPVDRPDSGTPVDPLDLDGMIVDDFGVPVDDVAVEVDDFLTKSSGGGKFHVPRARAKYTATTGWKRGRTQLVSYVGLTTRTPVLHLFDETRQRKSVFFTGTTTGFKSLVGCAMSTAGAQFKYNTDGSYSATVSWWNEVPSTVRFLLRTEDFSQSGQLAEVLQDTSVPTIATQSPLPIVPVSFTWKPTLRALMTLIGKDGGSCVIAGTPSGTSFVAPYVADAQARISFDDPGMPSSSRVEFTVPLDDKDFGTITLPTPPVMTSPVKDASMDESTPIAWQVNGGGTSQVSLVCADYSASIILEKSSALLPDVKVQNDVGAPRPRGGSCGVSVSTTSSRSTTDEWATGGRQTAPASIAASLPIPVTMAP
jgi:hypothetical protein